MEKLLEILGKVGFDWHMSLFNLINFLVAFWILKKFAFAPLMKIIEERRQKARETQENFDKANTEIAVAKQTAQKITDESRLMANHLMGEAQSEAKITIELAKNKAKEETQKVVAEAKQTILAEKEKMTAELKKETAELVSLVAEKVLGENLKSADDSKYVKAVMEKIKK